MSNCTCEYCPTIIVPGIGQSKVDLYSSDNKRIKCAWPLDVDTKSFVKKIIPSAIGLLITKRDKAANRFRDKAKNRAERRKDCNGKSCTEHSYYGLSDKRKERKVFR